MLRRPIGGCRIRSRRTTSADLLLDNDPIARIVPIPGLIGGSPDTFRMPGSCDTAIPLKVAACACVIPMVALFLGTAFTGERLTICDFMWGSVDHGIGGAGYNGAANEGKASDAGPRWENPPGAPDSREASRAAGAGVPGRIIPRRPIFWISSSFLSDPFSGPPQLRNPTCGCHAHKPIARPIGSDRSPSPWP